MSPVKTLIFLTILATHNAPPKRAPPPKFDKAVNSFFMENAFDALEGERHQTAKQEKKEAETAKKEKEQGNGDFDRSDMMTKLEDSENSIAETLSDKKTFLAATHKVEGGADIVIMMGRTLFSNDPDHGQDDDYLKFAEDMTIAAKQLKNLAKKGDYEGASKAFSTIKKNCNACHEKFRL
jgi:cytochrome c556